MAFYSYVPYTYGGPNGSTITISPGETETSELAVLGDTRYIWSDGALPDQDPRIGLKKLTKIQLPDAAASAYASMPTLDDQKAAKAKQVNSAFAKLQAYNCPSCYVTSSRDLQSTPMPVLQTTFRASSTCFQTTRQPRSSRYTTTPSRPSPSLRSNIAFRVQAERTGALPAEVRLAVKDPGGGLQGGSRRHCHNFQHGRLLGSFEA